MVNRNAKTVLDHARALLARGLVGDEHLRSAARLGEPIPIVNAEGELHSWFVPVLLGKRMAGFMQLTTSLAFLRYAGWPEPSDPALWLDAEAVTLRARDLLGPDAELSAPYLSFDVSPERVAWRVDAKTSQGERKTIFVAGKYSYEDRPNGHEGTG